MQFKISTTVYKHIAKAPRANAQTKALSKSLQSQCKSKLFLKNLPTLQKNKKRNAQPETDRQKNRQKITLKPNTDNGLQGRTTEHQLPTAVLQKWRFSASYDSFVLGSSSVLRLNFSGENRHLRKAAKRYR